LAGPKVGPEDGFVGMAIRMRRKELGLTQRALAQHLGITFQQLQKYEKGRDRIAVGRLATLAGLLQVPIAFFFSEGQSTPSVAASEVDLLGPPGAMDLLSLYVRIQDPQHRKTLLQLARSLARKTRQ